MKGLMFLCANLGDEECRFEELAGMFQRMVKNGLDEFSWPSLNQIEKYDRYCRSCKNCLLFGL